MGLRKGSAGILVGLSITLGCRWGAETPPPASPFEPSATRGYILISCDTLSALHLGAYGYERPTSPFFDALAARSTLFEQAWVQYPSTLISHMSMFTGLYPGEHAVGQPSGILSPQISTLPEWLREAGFRTAGHIEGGLITGGHGFQRGFEVFTDTHYETNTDVERTFGRGYDFLREVEPGERFFLFLHTYSVHAPYEPPEPFASLFWDQPPPATFAPTGENLFSVNKGFETITPEAARYFAALYDASIRYLDTVLEELFAQLDQLGLASETTVVITSDHGEEFLEHGKVAHTQVYPEVGRVPLVIVHPDQRQGMRIGAPVQSIDIAPTLLELAGVPQPPGLSGRSLLPLLRGEPDAGFDKAYLEVVDFPDEQRALVLQGAEGLQQVVHSKPTRSGKVGAWLSRRAVFDVAGPRLALRATSFHQPRTLRLSVDGEPVASVHVPTRWTPIVRQLPADARGHRVTLAADGCISPQEVGESNDTRCLSVKIAGAPFERRELFELATDPWAREDRSRDLPAELRSVGHALAAYRFTPVAEAGHRPLDAETTQTLRALGYVD